METLMDPMSSRTASTGPKITAWAHSALGENPLPSWWTEGRAAAWKQFQDLPMPKRKDEDWRFANVHGLQLEGFSAATPPGDKDRAMALEQSRPAFPTAVRAVFANDHVVEFPALPEALKKQGVVWETLETAVRQHAGLIQEHFMAAESELGSAKFAALHRAWCRAGSVLIIPKNVHIELPIAAYHWLAGAGEAVFPHTLIVAGENSSATFVDFFGSLTPTRGFACGVKDMILAPGAKVDYLSIQEWDESVTALHLNSVNVARDASGKYLNVHLGGGLVRAESHSRLTGTGSRSDMLGISVCHGRQEIDLRTLQTHAVGHSTSDLLYKNTLNHRSRAIFQGLIRVDPGASQTDAYQTNRNLLLDPEAEADSMPGLEILNDDVKCSHGATTGQIDAEELFYMRSRGIPTDLAGHLIALGFFQEVLDRFGHEAVIDHVARRIEAKFVRSAAVHLGAAAAESIDPTQVRELQGTESP
jgi:Fe-S cluster assembly protein SufD